MKESPKKTPEGGSDIEILSAWAEKKHSNITFTNYLDLFLPLLLFHLLNCDVIMTQM